MRIFLAGATGAIGQPLLRKLVAAGHDVVATSRDAARAAHLTTQGATGIVLDAFDADAVRGTLTETQPEVVIHQLTALPKTPSPRSIKSAVAQTTRLRRETVPIFASAARDAGTRRIVVQSISFVTAPTGPPIVDETHPLFLDAPPEFRDAVEGVRDMEHATLNTDGVEGVVLRYGFFYGPGTWYARDGAMGKLLAKRRLPLVGGGEGRYSWIHVDDAADVTIAAMDRGAPGVYNVCDSEPATTNEWMPVAAQALGAKPPRRLPAWLVRRLAGGTVVYYGTALRGASNKRMLEAFGVTPRPWRTGLAEALAS